MEVIWQLIMSATRRSKMLMSNSSSKSIKPTEIKIRLNWVMILRREGKTKLLRNTFDFNISLGCSWMINQASTKNTNRHWARQIKISYKMPAWETKGVKSNSNAENWSSEAAVSRLRGNDITQTNMFWSAADWSWQEVWRLWNYYNALVVCLP